MAERGVQRAKKHRSVNGIKKVSSGRTVGYEGDKREGEVHKGFGETLL